jgi:hypothetical protein
VPEGDEAMVDNLFEGAGLFGPRSGFVIAAGDEFGTGADDAVVVGSFFLADDDFRGVAAHGC